MYGLSTRDYNFLSHFLKIHFSCLIRSSHPHLMRSNQPRDIDVNIDLRTMRFLALSWEVLQRPPWGWRCARRASPIRVYACVRGRAMLCERASGIGGLPLTSGSTASGVWGELSILVAVRAFW